MVHRKTNFMLAALLSNQKWTRTALVGLWLTLAPALPLPAQSALSQKAEEESVRRQEVTIQLRQTIQQAQTAKKKGDLAGAATLYTAGVQMLKDIGSNVGVEKETQQVLTGLSGVRLKLAQQYERRGDLSEALQQVKDVLTANPADTAALQYKSKLDKQLAALQGRMPSKETLAQLPDVQTNRLNTATLVQDGRFLF